MAILRFNQCHDRNRELLESVSASRAFSRYSEKRRPAAVANSVTQQKNINEKYRRYFCAFQYDKVQGFKLTICWSLVLFANNRTGLTRSPTAAKSFPCFIKSMHFRNSEPILTSICITVGSERTEVLTVCYLTNPAVPSSIRKFSKRLNVLVHF